MLLTLYQMHTLNGKSSAVQGLYLMRHGHNTIFQLCNEVTKQVNVTSLTQRMTSTSDYISRGRLGFYAFSRAIGRLGSPKV